MERDAFLATIRMSGRNGTLPPHLADDPGPLVPDLADVDLVEKFTETLTGIAGVVHSGDPAEAVRRIVAAHGPGPFLAWDDDQLPVHGLADVLAGAGCEGMDTVVPADAAGRLAHQEAYFDVRYGLTGVEAGFAETGTIVVRSGKGRPRMASLIPLVHIAVLQRDRIVRSPMHWLVDAAPDVATAANVVYIGGPSRTADIEQRLELGVHGPREVHVILVN